ncbi:hypothetical protein PEBR_11927 [Penicillium brasilianum]|uniref:Uncharacterized protein n=1 Tax=Penicillium brasilianum TaxID=104259 RepID=A0A1S9RTR3_PENBI|nr:hypothetical protein PEBR_11927 [Penicillium brasilianum]
MVSESQGSSELVGVMDSGHADDEKWLGLSSVSGCLPDTGDTGFSPDQPSKSVYRGSGSAGKPGQRCQREREESISTLAALARTPAMGELNGGAKHGCRGEAPIVLGETADIISGREWHISGAYYYTLTIHITPTDLTKSKIKIQ